MTTWLYDRILKIAVTSNTLRVIREVKALRFKAAAASLALGVGLYALAVPNAGALQTLTSPLVQAPLLATTTALNWFDASYQCKDENAAQSGNTPAVVATSTTIPANQMRAAALITCAMIPSHKG